jgi:hypothetical protein
VNTVAASLRFGAGGEGAPIVVDHSGAQRPPGAERRVIPLLRAIDRGLIPQAGAVALRRSLASEVAAVIVLGAHVAILAEVWAIALVYHMLLKIHAIDEHQSQQPAVVVAKAREIELHLGAMRLIEVERDGLARGKYCRRVLGRFLAPGRDRLVATGLRFFGIEGLDAYRFRLVANLDAHGIAIDRTIDLNLHASILHLLLLLQQRMLSIASFAVGSSLHDLSLFVVRSPSKAGGQMIRGPIDADR